MREMEWPFVSVVIPARNEEKFIAKCIRSIRSGTYPTSLMEVIVVDGASEDRTALLVDQMASVDPAVRVLRNPDRVVPIAMNLGIAAARGAIIVRADAHADYPADYVERLVSVLLQSEAANVGGVWVTLPGNESGEAAAIAQLLSSRFGVGGARYRLGDAKGPMEVDTVPFGCFRKEVLERIGMFDCDMIRNQDDELNARLVKAGGQILLLPDVRVKYYARESLGKMAKMLFQYGHYKPLVSLKNGRPATIRQLAPPLFVLTLVGLPAAGLLARTAAIVWLAVVSAYLVADVFFSMEGARRHGIRVLAWLTLAYPIAHVSYGGGYLRGIWDFVICRKHVIGKIRPPSLSR